jgi:hypothetical protein
MSSRVKQAEEMVLARRAAARKKHERRGRHALALPWELTSAEVRDLEQRLKARGLRSVRYVVAPTSLSPMDMLETVLGLDEDEPRVEWEE